VTTEHTLSAPSIITSEHNTLEFDCGVDALNRYIQNYALRNHINGSARTYVTTIGQKVVGYYSLAYGSVSHAEATMRVAQGLAKHPIPIMLIARLAVDKTEQGKGLGQGLLKNALLRTVQAAEIGGLRAVVVHAKDQVAKNFYLKYGFDASPIDPLHLFLLMKDLRNNLKVVTHA
jgi:GNAT superfamily N-acetyltransferase